MVAKPLKTKSKLPVSRHPLFAPMVALWFAALFGLGSLAIRPTLLEAAVLALRLDLVVPAAAPPLGFTFRILLALTLFVIGGVIGFVLARTMTRDKTPQSVGRRFSSVKARAQTAAPVVVEDLDEDDDFNRLASARQVENEAANALPGRRRALAMEEDFTTEVHDIAPLPGHQPQILDLADLGAFDHEDQPEPAEEVTAPADLHAATEAEQPKFDPWNRHPSASAFVPAPADNEAVAPAPFAAPFDAPADFSRPQVIDQGQPTAEFAAPAFAAPASFTPAQNRAFDAPGASDFAHSASDSAEPVQHESVQYESAGHAVDAIVHPVAGLHGPANDGPANDGAAPAEEFVPAAIDFAALAPPVPEFSAPPVEQVVCTSDAEPSRPLFGTVSGDAAERLVAMPLTSLGVVQLAERLALAIARKRDGAAAGSVEAEVLPEATVDFSAPQAFTPQPPVPVAFPLPPSLIPPPPMDFTPPAPVDLPTEAEFDAEVEDLPAPATPLFAGLPAALRPVSFDDQADDDEPLPSILPPRGFPKLPEQLAAPEPLAPAVPQSFVPQVEPVSEPALSEAPCDDENYASLLEMKTPPRAFVRIEEPEVESAEVEPVVIFPGQDNRQSFGAPANGFGQNGSDSQLNSQMNGTSRLFDGPVLPNSPMRVPPAMARSIDAEETERQLKAALATLQRMSGAA